MVITEEIDTLPITDVKRDFYNLMNMIVMVYGDNQEEVSAQSEVTESLCVTGSC